MEEVPRPEVLESTNLFFWVSLNEQNLDHKLYAWCSRCTKVGYIEHFTLPIGGDKTDMYTRVLRSGLQRFCDAQAYVAAAPTHAGARLLGFQARTMHIKKRVFFLCCLQMQRHSTATVAVGPPAYMRQCSRDWHAI